MKGFRIVAKKTKKRKTSKKKKQNSKLIKFIKICALAIVLLLIYIGYCLLTLPNINAAVNRTRLPSTTIIANNGNEVQTFGTVYSEVIRSEELPQYVVDAIVYTEDKRFYSHFGFDIISFTRAMITNLFAGRYAQGGSTITQQVAKNLFLTSEKSIRRKAQELLLAFWLEHKFSKEQILTLYLNRVYLGSGAYGIEAASQKYFQKTSRDINIMEAAIIAGMLKAPSKYNPIASKDKSIERAKVVLKIMQENKLISSENLEQILTMPIGRVKNAKVQGAAYFADWVYNEINAYLGERDRDIYALTTLDQSLQEKASDLLEKALTNNKDKNVKQGAIVVMDFEGRVKAMVGGANYNKSQYNRAVSALRQPGSAFKPFVYITALQKGWEPEDIISDKPIIVKDWKPENNDKKIYGNVSLDFALQKSLNLATINLAQKIGGSSIIKTAKKMGITSSIENTPALALGTFEVSVLEMATAYTTIANGGFAIWPHAVEEIYSKDGFQLYQREKNEKIRILDKKTVKDISKMLENAITYGTGKKAKINGFAAGKTGTSQDNRDAWFVGFSNNLVAAVWVGNDDNSPMSEVYGSGIPAQIWKNLME
ncbi:MAG: PBP1A family penicillin-binding protein [Alphaproteobacteria bacterium]|nr:PBP1A family penicillin-binding protein [Alphaproteobacteria bacterium]